MFFQLILIMLREFQETIKTIEQLKKKKTQQLRVLIIFNFFIIRKGDPYSKTVFFMVKLNEICIFEASFPASWAEAQSWKQLICYLFNYFNCFLRLSENNQNN